MSARQKLLSTLAHKSFRLGEFKLSSGGTSDYYIDCRTTTLDAKGARLTGEVFFEEIRQRGWKPGAIGGATAGAGRLGGPVPAGERGVGGCFRGTPPPQRGARDRPARPRAQGARR